MSGTLIILEGPDCCGKTQLSEYMGRFFDGFVFHCTASKKLFPGLEDYHLNIMDNVEFNLELGHTVILDRFWPSEMAYGPLFRPDSGYGELAHTLQGRIEKLKHLYVFCFSENGLRRYIKGHTDPAHSLTREQYMQVWQNYLGLYKNLVAWGSPTATYSIEQDGSDTGLATFLGTVNEILTKS